MLYFIYFMPAFYSSSAIIWMYHGAYEGNTNLNSMQLSYFADTRAELKTESAYNHDHVQEAMGWPQYFNNGASCIINYFILYMISTGHIANAMRTQECYWYVQCAFAKDVS